MGAKVVCVRACAEKLFQRYFLGFFFFLSLNIEWITLKEHRKMTLHF